MWFWPGQTWDHHRVVDETYKQLHEIVGLTDANQIMAFGAVVLGLFAAVTGGVIHNLFVRLKPQVFKKMNFIQYNFMIGHLVMMVGVVVKMFLWHVLLIKYVWVTPWFNV